MGIWIGVLLKHCASGYTVNWLKNEPDLEYLAKSSNDPISCALWESDWILNLKWRWNLRPQQKNYIKITHNIGETTDGIFGITQTFWKSVGE